MPKRMFQKSVDGESVLVPKDLMEAAPIQLTAKALKALQPPKEKKPRSDAQQINLERMVAANKERKKIRDEEKALLAATPKIIEEEKKIQEDLKPVKKELKREKAVEEERQKLASGNFIKVVIQKTNRGKRMKIPVSTEEETTDTDITETENDTDLEEYKTKSRAIRRAVVAKKLVKTVEKIDRVIQQAPPSAPSNPYAAMLSSRWR